MSFSPALANRQRVLASLASVTAAPAALPEYAEGDPATAEYQGLLAALHNDLRQLHDIESVQAKIEAKRTMILAYLPWVEGWWTADDAPAVQDEIVVTVMIWALDIGNWALALQIAEPVLARGLALPERYKRNPACLVAEEVADAAKADAANVPLDVLQATLDLTAAHDMPDQVRAKLHRAIGLAFAAAADAFDPQAESAAAGGKPALVAAAIDALTIALRFDKNVGVKKQLEGLERQAKALAAPPGSGQT